MLLCIFSTLDYYLIRQLMSYDPPLFSLLLLFPLLMSYHAEYFLAEMLLIHFSTLPLYNIPTQ